MSASSAPYRVRTGWMFTPSSFDLPLPKLYSLLTVLLIDLHASRTLHHLLGLPLSRPSKPPPHTIVSLQRVKWSYQTVTWTSLIYLFLDAVHLPETIHPTQHSHFSYIQLLMVFGLCLLHVELLCTLIGLSLYSDSYFPVT